MILSNKKHRADGALKAVPKFSEGYVEYVEWASAAKKYLNGGNFVLASSSGGKIGVEKMLWRRSSYLFLDFCPLSGGVRTE